MKRFLLAGILLILASINIAAQNVRVPSKPKTITVTAPGDLCSVAPQDYGYVTVQVEGTFTGLVIVPEMTLDGQHFESCLTTSLADYSQVTTITATGSYLMATPSMALAQCRASAISTGSAPVTIPPSFTGLSESGSGAGGCTPGTPGGSL